MSEKAMEVDSSEEQLHLQSLVEMARLRQQKRPPSRPSKKPLPSTSAVQTVSRTNTPQVRTDSNSLSTEVLLIVVEYFMPRTGISISNDPEKDTDIKTIRALLKTTRWVREEILKRVFKNPLHLYISSGKRCRCHLLQEPKDICKTPWEKLFFLPFERFNEVVVSFAPTLCQLRCSKERQELKIMQPRGTDLTAREFSAAMSCVIRQSFCIGKIMEGIHENPRNRSKVSKIRFVCDDSGVQPLDAGRQIPLWYLNRIDAMLDPWYWTSRLLNLTPQVEYPKRLAIYFNNWFAWDMFHLRYDDPLLPDRVAQTIEREFPAWMARSAAPRAATAPGWSELVYNNSMPWLPMETLCSDLNFPVKRDAVRRHWGPRYDIFSISVEERYVNGERRFRWRGDRFILQR